MMNFDDLSQQATDTIDGLFQPPVPPGGMPGVQYTAPQPPNVQLPSAQVAPIPPMLQRGHGLLARLQRSLTGGDTEQQMGYGDAGISQQQVENARPSLFSAIVHGLAGQNTTDLYQHRLDNQVAHQQATKQIATQQAIVANRAAVMRQFPPPTSGSEDELRTWANRVFPLFTTDPEVSKVLSPLVDRFAQNKSMRDLNAPKTQMAQLGSAVTVFDPTRQLPNGTTGAFLDPASGQWVGSLDRGLTADQKKENAIRDAEADLRLKTGQYQFNETTGMKQRTAFDSQNQTLIKSADQYIAAKSSLSDAKTNPAATKTAILNFAATVDARAQLRQGTITFIQQIDPSWKGSVSAWFNKGLSGKLPADQLAMMEQVLDHMHYEQAKMYEQRYQGAIKAVPSSATYIRPTADTFGDILNTYQPPKPAKASSSPDVNDVDAYLKSIRNKKP